MYSWFPRGNINYFGLRPQLSVSNFHVLGRGCVLHVEPEICACAFQFINYSKIIMAEEGSLLFQVETNEVLTYTNTTISNNFLQDSEDEDEVIRKQEVNVHL